MSRAPAQALERFDHSGASRRIASAARAEWGRGRGVRKPCLGEGRRHGIVEFRWRSTRCAEPGMADALDRRTDEQGAKGPVIESDEIGQRGEQR